MTPVERILDDKCPGTSDRDIGYTFVPFIKDVCRCAKDREYGSDQVAFIAIGKFIPRKNLLNVVRAFAKSVREGTGHLTIIGENTKVEHAKYLSIIREEIIAGNLDGRIRILENLSFDEVQGELERHDVYVQASYAEPASIVNLEAMSHGLPIICCPDNGTASYIQDGIQGIFCSHDVDSIAAAMSVFTSNPSMVKMMGRAATEMISRHFDSHSRIDAFLSYLNQQ